VVGLSSFDTSGLDVLDNSEGLEVPADVSVNLSVDESKGLTLPVHFSREFCAPKSSDLGIGGCASLTKGDSEDVLIETGSDCDFQFQAVGGIIFGIGIILKTERTELELGK
jgi:hypothetical protein